MNISVDWGIYESTMDGIRDVHMLDLHRRVSAIEESMRPKEYQNIPGLPFYGARERQRTQRDPTAYIQEIHRLSRTWGLPYEMQPVPGPNDLYEIILRRGVDGQRVFAIIAPRDVAMKLAMEYLLETYGNGIRPAEPGEVEAGK